MSKLVNEFNLETSTDIIWRMWSSVPGKFKTLRDSNCSGFKHSKHDLFILFYFREYCVKIKTDINESIFNLYIDDIQTSSSTNVKNLFDDLSNKIDLNLYEHTLDI